LKSVGLKTRSFSSAEEFLVSGQQRETACLITDIRMPGMSGLDLQAKLAEEDCRKAAGDGTNTRFKTCTCGPTAVCSISCFC